MNPTVWTIVGILLIIVLFLYLLGHHGSAVIGLG